MALSVFGSSSAVLLVTSSWVGHRLTALADYNALKRIVNLEDATRRLALLQPLISKFAIDIVQKVGIRNQAADALSRLQKGGRMPRNLKMTFQR